MMADPTAPGRGPPVNQPATVVVVGTCSVPSLFSPRLISLVRTPMDGMLSEVGRATFGAVTADPAVADGAVGSDGAGIGAGLAGSDAAWAGESATTRPTVPTAMAASPAPSA